MFRRRAASPEILQDEASECGLAALAMAACMLGRATTLRELRESNAISQHGMSLRQLMEAAERLDLAVRAVRIEVEELKDLSIPCILHWSMNHYVLLTEASDRSVVINDPAVGRRRLSMREVSTAFTGVALEITEGPNFRRLPPRPSVPLSAVTGKIHGIWRSLAQIAVLALALEAFALIIPKYMQIVVDEVLSDGDKGLLFVVSSAFGIVLLLNAALSALRSLIIANLSAQFNVKWSANIFSHLTRLSHDYFLKRHAGDIISRFAASTSIQQTITTQFVTVLLDGIVACATLMMLFSYSASLATIVLVTVLAYAIIKMAYFQAMKRANLAQVTASARQQTFLLESIRASRTVRLANATMQRVSDFSNRTTHLANEVLRSQRLTLLFDSLSSLIHGAQRIVIVSVAAISVLDGNFTAGMLIAFVAYADHFTSRASGLIDYSMQYAMLGVQTDRLADIVLSRPEPHRFATSSRIPNDSSIEFRDVSFRYSEGESWILNKCSFRVDSGRSCAIIGASGSGKTTLVSLALGLLEPTEGEILIGGIPIAEMGKASYRAMVSAVLQDDTLLAGTIADNISFFDPEASAERVRAAAEAAGVASEIDQFPLRFKTLVGDMGSALSGGQQQRIFLARALYRSPTILILDEASSNLDLALERRIGAYVATLKTTRIVVSHRAETIGMTDKVLEVKQGNVVERDFVANAGIFNHQGIK